jgi:hypothetical protein
MMSANLRPTKAYLDQSRGLLKNSFSQISVKAIEFIFNRRANLNFTEAHRLLTLIQADPHNILEDAPPNLQVLLKRPRQELQITITDALFLAEIELIPELNRKAPPEPREIIEISDSEEEEELKLDAKPPARQPHENIELADTSTEVREVIEFSDSEEEEEQDAKPPARKPHENIELECKVCYGDYEASEMYHCERGRDHSVCKICLERFVSEQVHGNGILKFKCIGDVDCKCEYSPVLLETVLPEDLKRTITQREFMIFHRLKGCGRVQMDVVTLALTKIILGSSAQSALSFTVQNATRIGLLTLIKRAKTWKRRERG